MRVDWKLLLPLVMAACVGEPAEEVAGPADGGPIPDDPAADAAPMPPRLADCTGRGFPTPAIEAWQHWGANAVVLAGDPRHYAQDVIAAPGEPASIRAKFAYGAVWKDLEDERIAVFVDGCAGWLDVGVHVTDDDGELAVAVDEVLSPGRHEVRLVALGDGTQAITSLWVLPRGTHVVVTDVDGTMTTSDTELWQELLDGDDVPEAYPSAQALTRAHVERGHVVIYLTGRPYWLLGITRGWLDGQGFAPGPVHVTDSNADILPTDGSVGAFKAAWLADLAAQGYVVDLAYGNATTDIFAYEARDLEAWIIGDHAGERGTHAVTGSWAARTAEVASGAIVGQPY